ncbi:hypothetical protein DTO166G4_8463 [Paecilomyces variotii]|nr:hypothetical protein DTO166G4_8463 [Paecilomyces variotii]KAJ9238611.1 hypothetical protein DTO166G5_2732 [Paecilomyces variotii]KAJ9246774.1 hypothetical protein DTO207G8_8615 [Paecilomyces variotii]KAJ9267185.1 hypothetical protein DTO195F2_418 [Paecilomyces variotii]KAJ9364370.1 hypothetical protein DTO280E4_1616 [Paecilomyces variotii]
MKLFLIRHAETEHNVKQACAGATDSGLTNHGVIQIQRLAQYFRDRPVQFTRVFSSDLQRARLTATGLCQQQLGNRSLAPMQTPLLQEQHFGSLEGTRWKPRASTSRNTPSKAEPVTGPSYMEEESEDSMRARATSFLRDYILPLLLGNSPEEEVVAVVAHGIILRVLWKCIADLFDPADIFISPDVDTSGIPPGSPLTPVWSNTGFMELDMRPKPLITASGTLSQPAPPMATFSRWQMVILSVNSRSHLLDLRRTGGADHSHCSTSCYRFSIGDSGCLQIPDANAM